ncbi:MAG TPA: hypothetical protein VGH13_11265, partial [Xanthobacteraceae bacterium]
MCWRGKLRGIADPRRAISDTELPEEELTHAAEDTPGYGLVAMKESDINARSLRGHLYRIEQLDIQLKETEKRLRPLRLGWVERDSAATPRGQSEAGHILLCRGHFAQNACRYRAVQFFDNMGFHSGGPAVDQVDVGLRCDRPNDQVVVRNHVAKKLAAFGVAAGSILRIRYDEATGVLREYGEISPPPLKVCEPIGEVICLIFQHLGLDAVDLPHPIEALACLIELRRDDRDTRIQRRIFKRHQRLPRSDDRAGCCQHAGDEAFGPRADLGLI